MQAATQNNINVFKENLVKILTNDGYVKQMLKQLNPLLYAHSIAAVTIPLDASNVIYFVDTLLDDPKTTSEIALIKQRYNIDLEVALERFLNIAVNTINQSSTGWDNNEPPTFTIQ